MSAEDGEILLSLMLACGELALRCKSEERDEEADLKAVRFAGRSLRLTAVELVCAIGHDPLLDCTARLQETASELGVSHTPSYEPQMTVDAPVSWRELQLAEAEHLRRCDPESGALSRRQEICRYAISLTAISGEVATAIESYRLNDEHWKIFADLLLISLRLCTAAGDELTDHAVPRSGEELDEALGTDGGGF